jgi:hypothetical protein
MNFLKITTNFLAVILLISLIATPFLFARNFAKVAGVKSESKFLVISQVEEFPSMTFSQFQDKYAISFTKLGPSQAYLGVLIVNNPTKDTQTYTLQKVSGYAQPFFGEDPENQLTKISVPSTASAPISLLSGEEAITASQKVEFRIIPQ